MSSEEEVKVHVAGTEDDRTNEEPQSKTDKTQTTRTIKIKRKKRTRRVHRFETAIKALNNLGK